MHRPSVSVALGSLMILYKYRSLADLGHVLDIVLYQRLHCSTYDKLNDPFEGLFLTIINYYHYYRVALKKGLSTPFMPKGPVKIFKDIKDLPFDLSRTKICSLSSSVDDVRLWSHYADGHKGLVFEIDFSGIESHIYKVTYDDKLPTFGSTILTNPHPYEVLTHKTNHWSYEKEYRIINNSEYFPINKGIKAIYVGFRISDFHYDLLNKVVPNDIPIIRTQINKEEIKVEPNQSMERDAK